MEYKHERYILNNFGKFRNPEAEADFMEYDKAASMHIVRFLMLLMGFVFATFAFSDYYFYGGGKAFTISLALRGAALFITVVSFSLIGKIERYNHALKMVTLTELVVFVIYLVNLYNLHAKEPALQFMSMMLFILAVFLIPNVWKNCMIAGFIMLASYILFSFLGGSTGETPPLSQRGIYLGICLIACSIFILGRENSRRRQFAAEKLLEFMSITDRLTGIYNRGRFEYILGLWIKNMRHDPFCLILFDIDDFKKVNDNFGHNTGDQVLAGTAAVVTANIRDDDIFARWGGEEFVVLFADTGIERATELAERLRKAVENNHCGEAGNITISVGVVQYHRGESGTGGESLLEFVNRVDAKMYEAKKAGKNQVVAEQLQTSTQ